MAEGTPDPGRGAASDEPAAPTLAVQVARLFFDRQLSKVDIAARLGISRFRVARLIDQALADELVRIEFRDVPAQQRELARRIEDHWGIDLCIVADSGDGEHDPMSLARLGALAVDDLVRPGDTVGVAVGPTLARLVQAVAPRADASLRVVQLVGGTAHLAPAVDSGELARRLAERWGGTPQRLHAPAFVASAVLRDALLQEIDIKPTLEWFDRLSLALVEIEGIVPAGGHVEVPGGPGAIGTPDDLRELAGQGAVGTLAFHAFDAWGHFIAPERSARLVGIGPDQLRATARVVAIAGGPDSSAAISGALATGIIDVLVTNRAAVEQIAAGAKAGREAGRPEGSRPSPAASAVPTRRQGGSTSSPAASAVQTRRRGGLASLAAAGSLPEHGQGGPEALEREPSDQPSSPGPSPSAGPKRPSREWRW